MTLMNRNAPENVLLSTQDAHRASIELIEKWHDYDRGRLQYVVTPRFAISCTPDMLQMASELARKYDLWVQTHLSENQDEIDFTLSLFHSLHPILDLYKDFDLLHSKTIFAHCIHMTPDEHMLLKNPMRLSHIVQIAIFWEVVMSLETFKSNGIELMLGSDIGAGRSFSILMTAGRAYDNALLQNMPFPLKTCCTTHAYLLENDCKS